ncbi:hypothetical protein CCHR01_12911 [Colletotrichum chrysophilum]|uniref:Uncharacterized protein n=1 Tax=Colletotrichum chrysophilum TaxID=1836956 RepID=A0AAD9AAE8_9PEZI|nr:hypothetical protein CCHR01_12911 [Colletotrichum chrysophilum]
MDHLPLTCGADRNSTLDSTTSHYPTGPTPTTQHPREPPSTAAPCLLLTGRLTLVTAKRSPAIASVFLITAVSPSYSISEILSSPFDPFCTSAASRCPVTRTLPRPVFH